jgi:hypothetical protein
MPNTNWWDNPNTFKGFSGGGVTTDPSGTSTATAGSNPAYARVSSIPTWLPRLNTGELSTEYSNIGKNFDTSGFDVASKGNESRVLTTALNAGNNAATEYANRARQSGGSGMGAGLIKAEAGVGAQKSAGEIALQREQFDASQREKAAGLASQIATTLGNLRDSYLKTIVNYATSEDDVSARFAAVDATNRSTAESARQFNWRLPTSGGYQTNRLGQINSLFGTPFRDPTTGMPSSNTALAPTNRGWGG